MAKTSSSIQKRRLVRAAEHKRDTLIERMEKTRQELQKSRLELKQTRGRK